MTEAQKQKLLLPFPASDIEWRTAYTNTEKTQGFAVPFVNSRAIQERLDEILRNFRLQPRKKRMDKEIRRFGRYGH